jgi:hypothetical protein
VTTAEDLALAKIIAENIAILPISLFKKQNSTK